MRAARARAGARRCARRARACHACWRAAAAAFPAAFCNCLLVCARTLVRYARARLRFFTPPHAPPLLYVPCAGLPRRATLPRTRARNSGCFTARFARAALVRCIRALPPRTRVRAPALLARAARAARLTPRAHRARAPLLPLRVRAAVHYAQRILVRPALRLPRSADTTTTTAAHRAGAAARVRFYAGSAGVATWRAFRLPVPALTAGQRCRAPSFCSLPQRCVLPALPRHACLYILVLYTAARTLRRSFLLFMLRIARVAHAVYLCVRARRIALRAYAAAFLFYRVAFLRTLPARSLPLPHAHAHAHTAVRLPMPHRAARACARTPFLLPAACTRGLYYTRHYLLYRLTCRLLPPACHHHRMPPPPPCRLRCWLRTPAATRRCCAHAHPLVRYGGFG